MENVFSYLKSKDSFSDIAKLIDDAEKYSVSDPQASIIKASSILEIVVNRVIESEKLYSSSTELNSKINSLRGVILDRTINDMHSIRSIRNSSAAHVSYSTNAIQADKIESIFCLKKIYEILQWYVNFNNKSKVVFSSFEEYLESTVVEKNVIPRKNPEKVEDLRPEIILPKFYVDNEFLVNYKNGSLDDIDIKDINSVFALFFGTQYDLKTIEKIVFKNDKPDGNIVYAIITLYRMIGLTNSWRKFIQENGIANTKKIVSKQSLESNNIDTQHRLSILSQVLSNVEPIQVPNLTELEKRSA